MARPHLTIAAPPRDQPMDLQEAFAQESLDNLEQLDGLIAHLQVEPNQPHLLHALLRPLHTMRSNAATLQLTNIHRLSQSMESLVDHFCRNHTVPDQSILELLLSTCTHLKLHFLQLLPSTPSWNTRGNTPEGAPSALPPNSAPIASTSGPALQAAQLLLEQQLERAVMELTRGLTPQSPPIGELLVARGELSRQDLDRVLELQQQPTGALLVALGLSTPEQIAAALALQPVGPGRPHLRVDARRLEAIQELTSQLLMSSARLEVLAPLLSVPGKLTEVRRLARHLWNELQQLRMTSLGPLFERLADVAKQIASRTGRQLEVNMEGGELKIEAEYMVVLNSILPHAIRNAVDHGIETPADRQKVGKDVVGRVTLRAWRMAQELHIVIADDGAGLDLPALGSRARELKVADTSAIPGTQRYDMLFADGYTTRSTPGHYSGMGVGLSAIRETIQKLGGRIWIDGKSGCGAELHLVLPTKIEALDALVVRSNQLAYVLPASAVLEFVRPTRAQCRELRAPTPSISVRGTAIPLVWLEAALGRCPSSTPLWERLVVLVSLTGMHSGPGTVPPQPAESWGLVVDDLEGTQRLPNLLTSMEGTNGLCGQVVLEDGSVAEVLDLITLLGQ